MIKIVPFEVWHCMSMELVPEEKSIRAKPHYRHWMRMLKNAGNCYSAFDGDQAVFCGGVCILYPSLGEAWVVCSDRIRKYVRELYSYARAVLDLSQREYGLVIIQAHVRVSWESARRFVDRLGFECEGIIENYIDGEDYYRYVRAA